MTVREPQPAGLVYVGSQSTDASLDARTTDEWNRRGAPPIVLAPEGSALTQCTESALFTMPTEARSSAAAVSADRTMARASMYTMLGFTSVAHFLTREMGPQLVPFICEAYGFNDQQRGLLLGAYFPGYVCGQLPAALLADRIGGKRVISMSMWCTAAMMLCTGPTAASIPAAFAVSTTLGFAGGPLYPVHGILKCVALPATTCAL